MIGAPLLVWLLIAYGVSVPLRWLLTRNGFYRLVWHRALFGAAMLAVLVGVVSATANWIAG